ncbi:MAG: cell wall-binding repeat-containing protein [Actinomycetota bacterium]|nr:cell wall-binding repeat-containing protein [Actinomycetota bacterium]
MKHRTHRLRRLSAALALGVGMVGSVVGLAAGTAAALTRSSTISASSHPTVAGTGSGQPAGNLTLHLKNSSGATSGTSSVLTLTLASTAGASTVAWQTFSVSASGAHVSCTSASATLTCTLATNLATGATATVFVTGITYETTGAEGTITVTPAWKSATLVTLSLFNPTSVVNAVGPAAPPGAPASIVVTSTAIPIGVGHTGPGGTFVVTITGSTTETTGWAKTSTIALAVAPATSTECLGTSYVLFKSTPKVAFTASKSHDVKTTPKITASLSHSGSCSANSHNVLDLTFTAADVLTKTTTTAATAVFVVSTVVYSVGTTTGTGTVAITGKSTIQTVTTTAASNANVADSYVTANTPAVTVKPDSFDAAISPVKVVEAVGGQVPTGYVCVTLATTSHAHFNGTATPTVKVTGGNGTASTVKLLPTTGTTKTTVIYKVRSSTPTKPSTYVLSGLAVNLTAGATSTQKAIVVFSSSATCSTTNGSPTVTEALAFTVTTQAPTQIYGATADATAVKLLETKFPPSEGTCVGMHPTLTNNRPVILATDQHFQDALSAQYLASYLHTGVLLTPYGQLSAPTMRALKAEGVTQVFIVGGPLAVSTTVKAQIETLPAYKCGGSTKLTTNGHTRFISVTRIYGMTAADTAAMIAEQAPTTHVMKASFVGAYAGVNATKGNGAFNDTAGAASPAPLTGAKVPTAIIASSKEFQDAMAASTTSYWQATGHGIPVLLTTPTSLPSSTIGAIATLGIKQVILMGGQLAVANTVVTSLQSLGVEVMRVAGKTYTDTAAMLATFEMSKPNVGLDWDNTAVAVARGNGFTDGLVGGMYAGTVPEPILLTKSPTTVGPATTAFLKAHGKSGTSVDTGTSETLKIESFTVFGGPLAVSPAVVAKMQTDIG